MANLGEGMNIGKIFHIKPVNIMQTFTRFVDIKSHLKVMNAFAS